MLKHDRSELDYGQLVKKARRLGPGSGPKLKLALLADVSTQHLTPLLRVLFASNGVDVEIYEAGFDTVEVESLDPNSGLYAFGPQVIVILQSIMKLKSNFYQGQEDRRSFAQAKAGAIEAVWSAIRVRSTAVIVQSTFVLPYERTSGNFGRVTGDSLLDSVEELNREICRHASQHPSVLINDVDYLAAWVGRGHFLDEKLWCLAKSFCALKYLPQVAQNIVDISLASLGRSVKCVVLDLDNTIWGGIIGDDGLEGIVLGELDEDGVFRSFQSFLKELSARGIILAVCSKNDEAVAREVFQKHPGMVLREEDIAVFIANWDDKAANLRRIRDTLNIGFDSMVFLDDSPFERNLVRQLVPEIIVPELPEDPALYVRALSELNLFETASQSSLDAGRAALYKDQQKREVESKKFATLDQYLESLQTTAHCQRFESATLGRVAQLIQRSNQFNLTTRRYSEAECKMMMEDRDRYFPFTISVHDRFGDFGLINVVILRLKPNEGVLEIDTFLMSCRVLQRGVEQLAMNKILDFARTGAYQCVLGQFIPTAKNMMVKSFFEQFGFRQTATSPEGATHWRMETADYVPRKVFISEQCGDGAM
ncbi:MAG: FkbH domain-containing protein [Verrucomicrobia bacterium]|nr:MAG: FkbH domain-containing protein [Verrucomicrobiota bacterium]